MPLLRPTVVMADVIVMGMVTKELEAAVEAVMEAVMEAKEDLVDTTAAMVVTDHTVVDVVVTTEVNILNAFRNMVTNNTSQIFIFRTQSGLLKSKSQIHIKAKLLNY